jgi:hypothetical protein
LEITTAPERATGRRTAVWWTAAVAELERIDNEEQEYAPFGLIWAYAGLGDRDRAFAVLERAYEMRVDRMVWLNVDPLLDPLRSDPRFTDLVRRMGLPGAERS